MSMTLILWKAPVVEDSTEAEALLKPYYERGDDSAFESSADIATVSNEMIRRFPDSDDGPWGETPAEAERVLLLDIRWGADNAVIDAIVELAREYKLVLYDPQSWDVHLPDDPIDSTPAPVQPFRLIDQLKVLLMGAAAAGVFYIGWRIDVPVLDGLLMIIGGFFFSAVVFVFVAALGASKDDTGETR